MKIFKLFLPVLLVLIALAGPVTNIVKAVSILLVLIIFLRPKSLSDLMIILVSNLALVISDIMAIKGGFFKFAEPDYLGLPYWEFVAWGFWIFYTYRLLAKDFPSKLHPIAVVGSLCFSQAFALIENRDLLLLASFGILMLSLLFFHLRSDFMYVGCMALLGMAVELIGLYFGLWNYPNSNLNVAILQFIVMWAGIGLYFRNLIGPFLNGSRQF